METSGGINGCHIFSPISASNVNSELGRPSSQNFNMNDSAVRALAGRPSGSIGFNHLRGKSNLITASGGTKFNSGSFTIHVFTSPGTLSVSNAGVGQPIEYVVVAGGGGGGKGGGGAGGVRTGSLTASPGNYPVTIGGGGGGGPNATPGARGGNGGTSRLAQLFHPVVVAEAAVALQLLKPQVMVDPVVVATNALAVAVHQAKATAVVPVAIIQLLVAAVAAKATPVKRVKVPPLAALVVVVTVPWIPGSYGEPNSTGMWPNGYGNAPSGRYFGGGGGGGGGTTGPRGNHGGVGGGGVGNLLHQVPMDTRALVKKWHRGRRR